MNVYLTQGRMGKYIVQSVDDPAVPIPDVLLLFPHEDRDVAKMLREYGHTKLADKFDAYWEDADSWQK